MIQSEILRKLDELFTICDGCNIRLQLNKEHKTKYSRIDGHCNKLCSVGKKLQAIGRTLT